MPRSSFRLALSVVLLVQSSFAFAQSTSSCVAWNGDLSFLPNPGGPQAEAEATQILADISAAVGYSDVIQVAAVQMDGACAMRGEQGNKLIYFGAHWLEQYSGGSPWVKTGVLAHEIGHHINDHKPSLSDRWSQEYQADFFVGRAIRLLGGSLQDALSVAASEPATGHDHPPRDVREVAISAGYGGAGPQLTDAQITAGALRGLSDLKSERASALLLRAERFYRSSSPSPDDGRLLAQAIIGHVDALSQTPGMDEDIPAIVRTLNAVPGEWWHRTEWKDPRDYVIQALAFIDRSSINGSTLPPDSLKILKDLSRKIGYFVPPDRIVAAGPFRANLAYCATTVCKVRFVLHGYDLRDNLRFDAFLTLSDMSQGEFRDTDLGTKDRLYFNAEDLSNNPNPLRFKLYCVYDSKVIDGGSANVSWSAINEAHSGYTTWLTCESPLMSARLGIAVHPSPSRLFEPPVKVAPAPFTDP